MGESVPSDVPQKAQSTRKILEKEAGATNSRERKFDLLLAKALRGKSESFRGQGEDRPARILSQARPKLMSLRELSSEAATISASVIASLHV